MHKFIGLFFLLGLCWYVNAVSIDLVRTAGGHVGSHVVLGSSQQYRFMLFDLTETNFWTFARIKPTDEKGTEIPNWGSGPYELGNDKNAMFNVTNATVYSTTNYKTFFQFGYYDAPLSAPVYPIKVGSVTIGNTTVRNMTTQISVLPVYNQWYYEIWNAYFFDGVFGIGKGLLGYPYTNYSMGWMTNMSTILIYTPRDMATTGKLLINEITVPDACSYVGIAVNLSKVVYLRAGDFEFNITAVSGFHETKGYYYYYKTWPTTISTMSSFITVDNDTWDYIMGAVDQVFDPYAVVGNDIATPYFKVHCSEAEKLQLSVTIVDQNGESVDFVIPGSSLVKPNPNGDCLLKVKPSSVDAWILGTPFIENYCFQIDPKAGQVIFLNTTAPTAYPEPKSTLSPEPYDDAESQAQMFYNLFGNRG